MDKKCEANNASNKRLLYTIIGVATLAAMGSPTGDAAATRENFNG